MKFDQTSISGVHLLKPDVHRDQRGEFWRAYC
jgi:dTDP-4-dehydrorhamnose 3,5-epimerase-like enzyme